jgi:hypothetical protein
MKTNARRTLAVAGIFACAGAVSGQCQEPRSVSWFMRHEAEMTSRISWCRLHPQQNDMDCVNAMIACSNAIDPQNPGASPPACATAQPTPEKE